MSDGRGHNAWTDWLAANKRSLPRLPDGKINFGAAHDMFIDANPGFTPKPHMKRPPSSIYQPAVHECKANCKACLADAEQLKVKRKKKK